MAQPRELIENLTDTELVTIEEAARLLRISPVTVWRMIKSGDLPALRIGRKTLRIRKSDLLAIIQPAIEQESQPLSTLEQTEAMPEVSQEERQQAAYRILQRREEIGPINISVTELIHDGRIR
ncbi:MAG: helix-turn-helix domain-containing protein [Anaerolineae bacterium]|nr:helix-turn-helix domain-containing protein [Anaerolineae bacterium]